MGFDYKGAKNEGYSDAEIVTGLSQKLGFDLSAAKSAGYQDTEILNKLLEKADAPSGVPYQGPGSAPTMPQIQDMAPTMERPAVAVARTADTGEPPGKGRGVFGNIQAGFKHVTGQNLIPTIDQIKDNPNRSAMEILTSPLRLMAAAPGAINMITPSEEDLTGRTMTVEEAANRRIPRSLGGAAVALKYQKATAQRRLAEGQDPESTDIPNKILSDPKTVASTIAAIQPQVFLSMVGHAGIEEGAKRLGMKPYEGTEPMDIEALVKEVSAPHRQAVREGKPDAVIRHYADNIDAAVFDLGMLVGGIGGAGALAKGVAKRGAKAVTKPFTVAAFRRKRAKFLEDMRRLDSYAERLGDRLSPQEYRASRDKILTRYGIPPEAADAARAQIQGLAPDINLDVPAYLRRPPGAYVPPKDMAAPRGNFTRRPSPSQAVVPVGTQAVVPFERGALQNRPTTSRGGPAEITGTIGPQKRIPGEDLYGKRQLQEPQARPLEGQMQGETFTVKPSPESILRKKQQEPPEIYDRIYTDSGRQDVKRPTTPPTPKETAITELASKAVRGEVKGPPTPKIQDLARKLFEPETPQHKKSAEDVLRGMTGKDGEIAMGAAIGALNGIYTDEEGNFQKFDPVLTALGLGMGMIAARYKDRVIQAVREKSPNAPHYKRALEFQKRIEKDPRYLRENPDKPWLESNDEYLKSCDPDLLCQRSEGTDHAVNYMKTVLGKARYMKEMALEMIARANLKGLQTPCPGCYISSQRTGKPGAQAKRYVVGVGGYNGEFTSDVLGRKADATIQYFMDNAHRFYSSTDFKAEHIPGLIMSVTDMADAAMPLGAYSKEGDFARIFGPANAHINLSVGRDIRTGMDMKEAFKLREKHRNVGTIYVAYNDAEVLAALRHPQIDHVIPWHSSGLSRDEMVRRLNDNTIVDYTDVQHPKIYDPTPIAKGPRTGQPTGWVNAKPPIKPRLIEYGSDLNKYLTICKERELRPAFPGILEKLRAEGNEHLYMKLEGPEYGKFGGAYPYEPVTKNFDYAAANKAMKNRVGSRAHALEEYTKIADEIIREVEAGTWEPGEVVWRAADGVDFRTNIVERGKELYRGAKAKVTDQAGAFYLPKKLTPREKASRAAMKRYTEQMDAQISAVAEDAKIPNLKAETLKETVTDMKPEAADPLLKVYAERATAPAAVQGQRLREAIEKELFTPIENNGTSAAAVGYTKKGKFNEYVDRMPDAPALESGAARDSMVHPEVEAQIRAADVPDIQAPRVKLESTDIRRNCNTIDGGIYGPITENVLMPTRDTMMARDLWVDYTKGRASDIFMRNKITKLDAQRRVWDILNKTEERIGGKPEEGRPAINPSPNELAAAKEIRALLDQIIGENNAVRSKRGQDIIEKIDNYVMWTVERTWMDKLLKREAKPDWVIEGPGAPDYLNPNKVFNPHELDRQLPYHFYQKDKRLGHLIARYIETAGNDIFYTNAIQNLKAHTKILRDAGRPNAAWLLEQWSARALGGGKHPIDVWVDAMPGIRHVAHAQQWITRGLKRSVFPANMIWNIGIQTTSHVQLAPLTSFTSMVQAAPLLFSKKYRGLLKESYVYHQKMRSRTQTAGEWGETIKKFRALEKPPVLDTVADTLSFMTKLVEKKLTEHAGITAYIHGKKMGLKGRELYAFMDNVMQGVNSLYNHADLPGVLQSKNVTASIPFQTFIFEAANNMREIVGKTGMHKTMNQKKLVRLLEWFAGMYVANAVTQAAMGRSPWEWESFVPFSSFFTEELGSSGRYARGGRIVAQQYIVALDAAIGDIVERDDYTKMRKLFMRYHVPAGTQIERLISAHEAWQKGGRVMDRGGRPMFRISQDQKLRSYLAGPWATEQGIKESKDRFESYKKMVSPEIAPAFPLIPLGKPIAERIYNRENRKTSRRSRRR